jgi:hypothetical protein
MKRLSLWLVCGLAGASIYQSFHAHHAAQAATAKTAGWVTYGIPLSARSIALLFGMLMLLPAVIGTFTGKMYGMGRTTDRAKGPF